MPTVAGLFCGGGLRCGGFGVGENVDEFGFQKEVAVGVGDGGGGEVSFKVHTVGGRKMSGAARFNLQAGGGGDSGGFDVKGEGHGGGFGGRLAEGGREFNGDMRMFAGVDIC